VDRIPDLLGGIERLRAVLWEWLTTRRPLSEAEVAGASTCFR